MWVVTLDREGWELQRVSRNLASEEWDQAFRFRSPRGQRRFIAARGLLKQILAGYLHCEPLQVERCLGAFGKPRLRCGHDRRPDLRFNCSYSNGLGIFAFAEGEEIGVDVEHVNSNIIEEKIPEFFFTASETAFLRSLPRKLQPKAFFTIWTRKEAYVKARGEGFRIPLDSFEVASSYHAPAKLLSDEHCEWFLQSFQPAPGYIASLAIKRAVEIGDCWPALSGEGTWNSSSIRKT